MPDSKLNQRQQTILKSLEKLGDCSVADLLAEITSVSSKTIVRDLNFLQDRNLINKSGQARATRYYLSPLYELTKEIDKEEYFQIEPDDRNIEEGFNQLIFLNLANSVEKIFTQAELEHVAALTKKYQRNRSDLSPAVIQKEIERLTIEIAWKSSKIEGNTYSLLDTETLLKTGLANPAHSHENAQMLLNHKTALNYIIEQPDLYRELSLKNLTELHSLLVDKLVIDQQIRSRLVSITGTRYRPLDNEFQIREALENTCLLINQSSEPIVKALYASALLSYIQAFADGNKRTSRIACNAILMAHDHCPLSYRSIDITEYKKAVLLFYEQNNIKYLKELLLEQYEFAVNNYFC